jgi:hypothetical protein
MTATRLSQVLAAIDVANAQDPSKVEIDGQTVAQAWLYGRRMSETLGWFRPQASEVLQIAARAQHIERWKVPRSSYEEGRIAYLTWRKDLQKFHGERAGQLMREAGYGEEEVQRVQQMLRKERLKFDPDVQALEDVICLVFLAHEAEPFIAKHDDEKVWSILAKTARKMSPEGLVAAGALHLTGRLSRLLGEALQSS